MRKRESQGPCPIPLPDYFQESGIDSQYRYNPNSREFTLLEFTILVVQSRTLVHLIISH